MTVPEPEREPKPEGEPEPGNAEQPCPATGAHWLDGWVVFGIAYP
ncbi:hypothetical protein SAMN05660473_03179 [Arthrobacter sp. 49Tsu3.1M3]|jgi:hypothetical protein|nr:hypothetical protein SAMN05660473_03179 [Arthrobacter sp. 49Tsu3.1M3]